MTRSTLLTVLMTLSLFAFNPAWGENEPDWHAPENYRLVPFEFPVGARHLYLVDLNADKQRDLLIDMSTELLVVFQSETGFDVSSAATITFEDANVAWDLAKGYSPNRNTSILALIDGRRVEAWNIDGQTLSGPHLLLDDLNAYVPEGQQTMRFCRDVNSDGIDDLLIPTTDSILIYLRTIQGEFRSAGTVKLDGKTESRLVSDQLGGTLGQSVTIPALVLRDVNGDGFSDLVVQTDEMLEVTIADPATDTFFPDSPTYARDFSAFQDRMKRVGIDDIDFF